MNGLEWIAGIREMDAAESRSAQWVLSRAQGMPPDAHLEPPNAHLPPNVQVVVSHASRQVDEWFRMDCWHQGNGCC